MDCPNCGKSMKHNFCLRSHYYLSCECDMRIAVCSFEEDEEKWFKEALDTMKKVLHPDNCAGITREEVKKMSDAIIHSIAPIALSLATIDMIDTVVGDKVRDSVCELRELADNLLRKAVSKR